MITPEDLARKILRARPNLATVDRDHLQQQVREYIQENYLEVFSRIGARQGLQLEVDSKDKTLEQDLQPYYLDSSPVINALDALLSGNTTEPGHFTSTQQPTQQVDPTQMSQSEYVQWRQAGNSVFRQSAGILD